MIRPLLRRVPVPWADGLFEVGHCASTRGFPDMGHPRHSAVGVPAALSGLFGYGVVVWFFGPEASGPEREKKKEGRPPGGKAFCRVRLIGGSRSMQGGPDRGGRPGHGPARSLRRCLVFFGYGVEVRFGPLVRG